MGVVVRNLEAFAQLGTAIVFSIHAGMKRVAEHIKTRLEVITPPWYGESLRIEERSLAKIYVGPSVYVPENDEDDTIVKEDVCAEYKFQFADIRHKRGKVRPYLRQMKDEMISSGLAKSIVVDQIVDDLNSLFRG